MAKECWICKKQIGFIDSYFMKEYQEDEKITLCEACNNQIKKIESCNDIEALEEESVNAANYFSEVDTDEERLKYIDWYKEKRESEIERKKLVEEKQLQEYVSPLKDETPATSREKFNIDEKTRQDILEKVSEYKKQDQLLYDVEGCRGRSIKVYENRVVITTDVTLGSILTNNATDGEKTIFYKDVIGIQFKKPRFTIGYLQLETSSGQMNNIASNAFSENTFTFESNVEIAQEMRDYIEMRVAEYKGL